MIDACWTRTNQTMADSSSPTGAAATPAAAPHGAAAAPPGAFSADGEQELGTASGTQIITLDEAFSTVEVTSKELYVRECMRDILKSLKEVRKSATEERPNVNAAVIGQPGIGKSCSLCYFAYAFLQEDDIELVVILDDEENKLCAFCNGNDKTLEGVHQAPKDVLLDQLQDKLNEVGKRAILLVDMDQHKNPRDRLMHSTGLTVYTSSPGPFKKWLARMRQKLRLKLFSPPPLTRLETEAVHDRITSKENFNPEMTLEDYFDVFGGTIRPMMGADEEFEKMTEGSSKLLRIDPATIVDVVNRGAEEEGEDFTQALFSDPGGKKEDRYQVPRLSTSRRFRSKFSEFWFRQHVAPRILFKKCTAEILSVLYAANKVANGGAGGCEFEDLFHKLLPLGNWKTEALSEQQEGSTWHFLAGFLGAGGILPSGKLDSKQLALMNVPVVQRGEDETAEMDLDERWNKKFGDKKDGKGSTTAEAQKEDNRRDVAKLIAACKEKDEFYWLPLGPHFPGLDSVHNNASSLNFFQVKTGGVAEDVHKLMDPAIHFSQLLFELMPIDNKDQLHVSIIVGTEPAREPSLKKRKLEKLDIPENWNIRYVSAPVADEIPKQLELDMTRYQNELKAEFLMFKTRQQILERPRC